jgi:adenosylcobinamide-GDP ribazoletransferase
VLHELRLFLLALQFLTRVPIPVWVGFREDWMHASARHYPAVGLVVGAFGAAVLWTAGQLWPGPLAVLLSMASTVWLTGAFHEDGFADSCDGLGGAVSRERALAIMKDSRLGTYGTAGLVFMLALKAAALMGLAELSLGLACTLLVCAHVLSRAVPVALLRALPYAGDVAHAKAKPMAQQVGRTGVVVALCWSAATAAALVHAGRLSMVLVLAMGGAAVVTAWIWTRLLHRRLGGYTGDTLGAAQQLAELSMLLVALAMAIRMPA